MTLKLALAVIAAVFFLLFFIWKAALPVYAFNYLLKRKDPDVGVFLAEDMRAVAGASVSAPSPAPASAASASVSAPVPEAKIPWIDTVDRKIAEIRSHDGLKLRAYFAAAPGGSADTVILAQGYSGNGKQLSVFGRFYYEDFGFNVLMPHARSHGSSEGRYSGFGWLERLDYLRWVDWARERRPGARIVLHGLSMGGAAVMMAAGESPLPPELKAVIDDCGYTSMEEELRHQMKARFHFAGGSLLKAASRVCRRKAGYSFEEVSSVGQLRKSRLPLLVIHGEEDDFVPFSMAKVLFDASPLPPERKEYYPVPGAAHGEAFLINP
ncbi:MAG: alpha/beta hydrolase, partial [Treponema sp.]|nr:alpha/beta hydrolase [Treponema sp.]